MTILAATDRSDNSRAALHLAARLAKRLDEPLVVVTAVELWERTGSLILPSFEDVDVAPSIHSRESTEAFVADALPDAKYELRIAVGHPPADRILEVASEVDASFIVGGTTGQNAFNEAFFGSTISALVRRSIWPVLAVPPRFDKEVAAILAPVDFTENSAASLAYAAKLAERLGARLVVQHSAPFGVPVVAAPLAYVPESAADVRQAAAQRLSAMVAEAGIGEQVCDLVTDLGPPHRDILDAVAERGIDMVVMGTHGRGAIARFFLGSTAERMLRERACPVMIVPHVETE